MNRKNLLKLAHHIELIPPATEWSVVRMFSDHGEDSVETPREWSVVLGCMQVVFPPIPEELTIAGRLNIDLYTDRVLRLNTIQWAWVFSEDWNCVDDTALGFAQRIRFMLSDEWSAATPFDCRLYQMEAFV